MNGEVNTIEAPQSKSQELSVVDIKNNILFDGYGERANLWVNRSQPQTVTENRFANGRNLELTSQDYQNNVIPVRDGLDRILNDKALLQRIYSGLGQQSTFTASELELDGISTVVGTRIQDIVNFSIDPAMIPELIRTFSESKLIPESISKLCLSNKHVLLRFAEVVLAEGELTASSQNSDQIKQIRSQYYKARSNFLITAMFHSPFKALELAKEINNFFQVRIPELQATSFQAFVRDLRLSTINTFFACRDSEADDTLIGYIPLRGIPPKTFKPIVEKYAEGVLKLEYGVLLARRAFDVFQALVPDHNLKGPSKMSLDERNERPSYWLQDDWDEGQDSFYHIATGKDRGNIGVVTKHPVILPVVENWNSQTMIALDGTPIKRVIADILAMLHEYGHADYQARQLNRMTPEEQGRYLNLCEGYSYNSTYDVDVNEGYSMCIELFACDQIPDLPAVKQLGFSEEDREQFQKYKARRIERVKNMNGNPKSRGLFRVFKDLSAQLVENTASNNNHFIADAQKIAVSHDPFSTTRLV